MSEAPLRFKSRLRYSPRAIRAMSYDTRQKLFDQEKDELFRQLKSLPGSEYQREMDALIEKWRV